MCERGCGKALSIETCFCSLNALFLLFSTFRPPKSLFLLLFPDPGLSLPSSVREGEQFWEKEAPFSPKERNWDAGGEVPAKVTDHVYDFRSEKETTAIDLRTKVQEKKTAIAVPVGDYT